ncbi:hypothetical protein PIROE2DRAFT_5560 [Piromyces sp. E2]|nr:hypothetical protein PIROE2DRAFT_5560 [Piromyces sp. E2]|eukprot:OUM67072.1 hypothetical protein PIROE2DRAFT_5560 [Piromyces sp. E2]
MEEFLSTINTIGFSNKYNKIKINLIDKIYNVTTNGRNSLNIFTDIIFYSEKGTIFDFQNSDKSHITIEFKPNLTNAKIIFQNITFYNYNYDVLDKYLLFFDITYDHNDFLIEFDNCTFKNINSCIFSLGYYCMKSLKNSPQIIFNNCKFL